MSAKTFADPEVRAFLDAHFVVIQVDVDRETEAAGWFCGSGIPDV